MTCTARHARQIHIRESLMQFDHIQRILIVAPVHAAECACHLQTSPCGSACAVLHQQLREIRGKRLKDPVEIPCVVDPDPFRSARRGEKAVHIQFQIRDPRLFHQPVNGMVKILRHFPFCKVQHHAGAVHIAPVTAFRFTAGIAHCPVRMPDTVHF